MKILATDIGGSHLTSAIMDSEDLSTTYEVIETTYDAFASRENITSIWREHFAKYVSYDTSLIAIPGPIDYDKGRAKYKPNTKLGALSNDNIIDLLKKEVCHEDVQIQLVNDAFCFTYGLIDMDPTITQKNTICLTLGTGLGSTIIHRGNIVSNSDLLYKEPLYGTRSDDYFSTRWFITYAQNRYKVSCSGVKELIDTLLPQQVQEIFDRFTDQLLSFIYPFIKNYNIKCLIIGGNIARAEKWFAPKLSDELDTQNIELRLFPKTTDIILRGVASRYQPS